jgi:hypothetical protein
MPRLPLAIVRGAREDRPSQHGDVAHGERGDGLQHEHEDALPGLEQIWRHGGNAGDSHQERARQRPAEAFADAAGEQHAQDGGYGPDEEPAGWTVDARSQYIYRPDSVAPTKLHLVDVASGQRKLWKKITPADPSGTYGIGGLAVNPDGKSYVYNLGRTLSDLYLVGRTEVETGRNRVASALVAPSGIGMRRRGRQRPVDAATAMSDKVLREIQPSSENCGMYAGLLGIYRGLYPSLRGPIARLAGRTKG